MNTLKDLCTAIAQIFGDGTKATARNEDWCFKTFNLMKGGNLICLFKSCKTG